MSVFDRMREYGVALFRAWEILNLGIDTNVKNKRKNFNLGDVDMSIMLEHLRDEVLELQDANHDGDINNIKEELADAVSICLHVAHAQGISPDVLFNTVIKKLVYRFHFKESLDGEIEKLMSIPDKDRDLDWYNQYTHLFWTLHMLKEQAKQGNWDVEMPT